MLAERDLETNKTADAPCRSRDGAAELAPQLESKTGSLADVQWRDRLSFTAKELDLKYIMVIENVRAAEKPA